MAAGRGADELCFHLPRRGACTAEFDRALEAARPLAAVLSFRS
ncbi:MAG: hypothetical protein ACOY93_22440 [Bacillota bacterium]